MRLRITDATDLRAPAWVLDRAGLLSYFGPSYEEALARYRAFCEEDDGPTLPRHPLIDGDETFTITTLERIARSAGVPRRYFQAPRPALAALLVSSGPGAVASAREAGYGVREIARHLGVAPSTVSRRLRARSGRATDET